MKKGFTPKNSFWNFKGFTLLELLITIIILGILAAIAIPIYTSSVERARGDACISNMRAIFSAWKIYNIKNQPDYDPEGAFRNVNTINNSLGIVIDEGNFGNKDIPEYGFEMNFFPQTDPPAGDLPRYYLNTYRRTGEYAGRRLYCNHYPNGNEEGIYYDWEGAWPWLPPDE